MHKILKLSFVAAAVLLGLAQFAAASSFTIDFENLPNLPAQPNNFVAAGPMVTYSNGSFSVSGGVVLGNPSFLASFAAHGSPPNLYGTTDIADPTLLDSITLTFPMATNVLTLSGILFNGQAFAEDYTIMAFAGMVPLATDTFLGVQAASDPADFRGFIFNSAVPITSVVITTPNFATNGWDFFVDTIGVNQTIPEPATSLLLIGGLGVLAGIRRRLW